MNENIIGKQQFNRKWSPGVFTGFVRVTFTVKFYLRVDILLINGENLSPISDTVYADT
jgi:hypothetical protein